VNGSRYAALLLVGSLAATSAGCTGALEYGVHAAGFYTEREFNQAKIDGWVAGFIAGGSCELDDDPGECWGPMFDEFLREQGIPRRAAR
jgi:hypothetical protein